LIGNTALDAGIEMKTNKELYEIGKQTQNSKLVHQVMLNEMHVYCYFREYLLCAQLAENHHNPEAAKRTLDFMVDFYAGICECFILFFTL